MATRNPQELIEYEVAGGEVLIIPHDKDNVGYPGNRVPRKAIEMPVTIIHVYVDDPKGARRVRAVRIAYFQKTMNEHQAEIPIDQIKEFRDLKDASDLPSYQ